MRHAEAPRYSEIRPPDLSAAQTNHEDTMHCSWFRRYLLRRARSKAIASALTESPGGLRLHFGCGQHLLDGWLNFDLEPPAGAFLLDARQPLPFPSACSRFIFHEHFLEHLRFDEGLAFLTECARVLRPGGIMRMSTPDLRRIIATYLDVNPDVRLHAALERHKGMLEATHPVTPAVFFNDKMRGWGHRFIYDEEILRRRLHQAGFSSVVRRPFGHSEIPALRGLETHADVQWMRSAEPLIVEARIPEDVPSSPRNTPTGEHHASSRHPLSTPDGN